MYSNRIYSIYRSFEYCKYPTSCCIPWIFYFDYTFFFSYFFSCGFFAHLKSITLLRLTPVRMNFQWAKQNCFGRIISFRGLFSLSFAPLSPVLCIKILIVMMTVQNFLIVKMLRFWNYRRHMYTWHFLYAGFAT